MKVRTMRVTIKFHGQGACARSRTTEKLDPAALPPPSCAGVQYAVQDSIVWAQATPDDPDFRFQWGLPRVGAPAAWDIATGAATPGGAVTVCVTDSGVDAAQPDLAGNLHPLVGYNALTKDSNVEDDLHHGTHVAGVVGAMGDNGRQVTGMSWSKVRAQSAPQMLLLSA